MTLVFQLPEDESELHARLWAAERQFDEPVTALEEQRGLDPMLADRLRDARQEHSQDLEDEEAEFKYVAALVEFLGAVVD